MDQIYNIAVVGATGNVGREILNILDERDFPIDNLYLLASSRSKGQKINFKDQELIVEDYQNLTLQKHKSVCFLQVVLCLKSLHPKLLLQDV